MARGWDTMTLPYITGDIRGIGGRVKEHLADFRVEEIPLYQPCGEGTHVYFRVVKTGVPTPVAIDRIARYMGVPSRSIGVAGLKDARAVTSQMMSLEHVDQAKLSQYADANIKVVWTGRHTNKLKTGHLAANSFVIRIRQVAQGDLAVAQDILAVLMRRGVPNYFGPQRFGLRGDTALLGEAIVRGKLEDFLGIYLGRSQEGDPPDCCAARDAFDSGYLDRALKCWPRHYRNERRALAAYKKKKRADQAMTAIDRRMRRLYVSAFQSAIFNEILAGRIDTIDRVFAGDLARKTDSGGVFTVVDELVEQPRAAAFEISPSALIIGYRAELATQLPGENERSVLKKYKIAPDDFEAVGKMKIKGARRAMRFRMESPSMEAGVDEHGDYLQITFSAPPGCYATAVLREIMKTD